MRQNKLDLYDTEQKIVDYVLILCDNKHEYFKITDLHGFQVEYKKQDTYSYKKVDHKKYVKGKVDLLSNIVAPFLTPLHFLTGKENHHHNWHSL